MSFTSSHFRRRDARRTTSPLPLYAFIAYGEISAARDALERVKQMLRPTLRDRVVLPMLWRFDQLGDSHWQPMALQDAQRAHLIVLAMGDAATLDPGAERWLTMLADQRAGAPTSCLVFMRDEEAWTVSLQRCDAPERTDIGGSSRVVSSAA